MAFGDLDKQFSASGGYDAHISKYMRTRHSALRSTVSAASLNGTERMFMCAVMIRICCGHLPRVGFLDML
jgi:hypothetical protein